MKIKKSNILTVAVFCFVFGLCAKPQAMEEDGINYSDVVNEHYRKLSFFQTKLFFLESNSGVQSYLAVDKVQDNDYQRAHFCSLGYLNNSVGFSKFFELCQNDDGTVSVKSNNGSESYLAVKKVSSISYQWAIFAQKSYLDSNRDYSNKFHIVRHVNGTYSIQSNNGSESYLAINHRVKEGDYRWALFGTQTYLNNNTDHSKILKIIFTDLFFIGYYDSNSGVQSYLAVDKVKSNNYQRAYFCSQKYLFNNNDYSKFFELCQNYNGTFSIKSNNGSESYLAVDKVSAGNYQWTFFGTQNYLDSNSNYSNEFHIVQKNGQNKDFNIRSNNGSESYLAINHSVKEDDYRWAFFGTREYLDAELDYPKELSITSYSKLYVAFKVTFDENGNKVLESIAPGNGNQKDIVIILDTNKKKKLNLCSHEEKFEQENFLDTSVYRSVEAEQNKDYFGLSIDGGGIRGLMPAIWLKILEERIQKDYKKKRIVDLFDCIGGTSVGGMLALGVSVPLEISVLVNMFKENKDQIFPDSKNWFFPRFLNNMTSSAKNFIYSRYDSAPLESLLKKTFGEKLMLKNLKTNVFITSCDTDGHPFYFANTNPFLEEVPVWEVARCTSAAPTYFKAYKIVIGGLTGQKKLVDGGIWANNPSPFVAGRLIKEYNANFSKVHLLSLGTGETFNSPIHENAGRIKTVVPILEALMSSNNRGNHLAMQYFLGNNYDRINCRLKHNIELDNVSDIAIKELETMARNQESVVNNFYNKNKTIIKNRFESQDSHPML